MNYRSEAAPGGAGYTAEGHELKPALASGSTESISRPERMARTVLAEHFPGGVLAFWCGDFYRRYPHRSNPTRWSRLSRRALAPYIYQTLRAHGAPASTTAVRELTLAISALPEVLMHGHPSEVAP